MLKIATAAIASLLATAPAWAIPVCHGGHRAEREVTCLVDGDTGWENGVKWRAEGVDTPELFHPGCKAEKRLGIKARDRLQDLMAGGYQIEDSGKRGSFGRELVHVRLPDGRIAGQVLIDEGLSQPWPNKGNRWCR